MTGNILELTEENFQKEVMESDIPVLVDFWAEWCSPCKALAPALHEMAGEAAGKFKIAKVNVDDNSGIANAHNVMNIPTMIIFKGGEEIERLVGLMSKLKILSKIESVI